MSKDHKDFHTIARPSLECMTVAVGRCRKEFKNIAKSLRSRGKDYAGPPLLASSFFPVYAAECICCACSCWALQLNML